jgi:hypothetical protein
MKDISGRTISVSDKVKYLTVSKFGKIVWVDGTVKSITEKSVGVEIKTVGLRKDPVRLSFITATEKKLVICQEDVIHYEPLYPE